MTTPEIIACTQPKKYIVRTLVVRIFKKKEKKNRVIVEIWEYLHYYKYYISTRLKEFKNRNTWMMNKLAMIERILSWNFSSLLFANEIQCFIQDVYIYICNVESSIEIWLRAFHYVCKIAGEVSNFCLCTYISGKVC